jgi:hypothetical protein
MQFWLSPPNNVVCVDDASTLLELTGFKNINLIWWHGSFGEIQYKDRLALREPFYDPSPYYQILDKWMLLAQSARKPISLIQAKMVKQNLTECLYHYRRQRPISIGEETVVANDENFMALMAQGSQAAVNAILSRRNILMRELSAKRTIIESMTTVPQIAAYDITLGWL